MNQTRKEPVNDVAKPYSPYGKRRTYLWATTKVHAVVLAGFIAATCFGVLLVTLICVLCVLILVMVLGGIQLWMLPATLGCAISLLVFGLFIHYSVKMACSVHCPPYVPPIAEQIAALPAHEILLRGTDEPVAMSDELLRAATAGKVEMARDLLRAGLVRSDAEQE